MKENHSDLHIVMYHYVRDLKYSRYPQIKGMDYHLFKEQISFFKRNFNIITMEEVIEAWDSNQGKLPEHALLLTFDDGYIDNFTNVFPILKQNHIQGSFFVSAKTFMEHALLDVNKVHFILASAHIEEVIKDLYEWIDYYRKETKLDIPENQELFQKYAEANRFDCKETIFVKRILQNVLPEKIRNEISSTLFRKYVGLSESVFAKELYMSQDQISCMKSEGMHIGLHGYEHYWLGKLPEAEMKRDIEKALDTMGDFINPKSWVMNYPYGSFNQNVINFIASKGCCLGLSTEVGIAETGKQNQFHLPRFDCNDFPPKSEKYKNSTLI